MCGKMTTVRGTGAVLCLTLPTWGLLVLLGAARASPVESESAVQLTSEQVLRRVAAWLDSEELQQRRRQQQQQQQQNEQQEQGQRALHSIQEQIDRMALELERLETKMDLKMDRLQEVLIGRDIKWDATSRRQESQLERTALLLTEVSGQLQRIDSDVKGTLDNTNQQIITLKGQVEAFQSNVLSGMTDIEQTLTQQPGSGHVTPDWTNDVIPELRRLVLHEVRQGRQTAEHTHSRAGTQGEAVHDTGQHGSGTAEMEESHRSTQQEADETEDVPLDIEERQKMEDPDPALRLLEAMDQLEEHIQSVSEQLADGLVWLDARVGRKFRRQREDLATVTSSLRKRFFERRNHLEEVAEKIVRLLTAQAGGDTETDTELLSPDVITALENAIYDVFDTDLWYMLPAQLEEAVSGQGNLTSQIGQMDRDMHQGFSKLYAQMTRLSFDLVKSAEDLGESARDRNTAELTVMFGNISRQLQDIQLKLDDRRSSRDQTASETSTQSDRPRYQQTSQRPAENPATSGAQQTA